MGMDYVKIMLNVDSYWNFTLPNMRIAVNAQDLFLNFKWPL
jgi:hypothetical protein